MTDSASENSGHFAGVIGPERNFDIINKKINIGQRATQLFMIDGFTKDEIMEKLIESLIALKPEDIPQKAGDFAKLVPYIDVTPKSTLKEAVDYLLMGMVCMFVDGYKCCFVIDCRTYPARSVSEPWKDRVLRGSRDGFVESIVANVTLIRRRIRTPDFCVEVMNAGTMSNTDIAFAYIQGKADMKLLADLKKRVEKIKVEALTMNIESLAEVLLRGPFINPFPKFKYSERPDSAAASIYDGNIVILIDNSPAVLVVPTSVFDVIEEADDYYFPPLTGTYIKLSKYLLAIMSLIMTPLWIVFLRNPGMVPEWFKFIMIEEGSTVPVILQLLILEFCIDGLRLAAVNTPTLLTTPLSIIAGIVVGEYAVSSGWFDPESMLYMAFVTVGTYTQASYELGYAIKFFRMIMLILAWFFGIWGFAAGIVMFVLAMAFNRTISEKSYLYPLIPFDGKMLARKLLRLRLGKEK
ncbi:MAG TPA: spore germination protein [Lachnospiraceae bacterium]|nr:spore germination protein [Lachnospiraceae bacterium]